MDALKDENTFIKDLIIAFPEIEQEVKDEDYKGLIGLQIGCLQRFTQTAIDNNNWNIVVRSFNFVDDNIGKVEQKIENSLYISYLNKLIIERGSKVEKLLPTNLKEALNDLTYYNSTLSQNKKFNKFLKGL